MNDLRKLSSNSTESNIGDSLREKCYHYWRWLREDIYYLTENPLSRFTFSSSHQPLTSNVRKDAYQFLAESNNRPKCCGRTLGGYSDFPAQLASTK